MAMEVGLHLSTSLSNLFTILISDNASDGPVQSQVDAQSLLPGNATLLLQPVRLPAWEHFKSLALLCEKSEYFAWVADDDIWDPEFFREAVRLLDDNSRLGLVWPTAYRATPDGSIHGPQLNPSLGGRSRVSRQLAWQKLNSWAGVFGVYRTELLCERLRTFEYSGVPGDDVLFINHMLEKTTPIVSAEPTVAFRWVDWNAASVFVSDETRAWYSSRAHSRLLQALIEQTIKADGSTWYKIWYGVSLLVSVVFVLSPWHYRMRKWVLAERASQQGVQVWTAAPLYRSIERAIQVSVPFEQAAKKLYGIRRRYFLQMRSVLKRYHSHHFG